ncbi:hypothetical protein Tco_0611909, partial [Tanacetum coccineum]
MGAPSWCSILAFFLFEKRYGYLLLKKSSCSHVNYGPR